MDQLGRAKEVLEEKGIIIFPTETVFGVGCLLKFENSIDKLYQIKKRPNYQPTLILVPNLQTAEKLVTFNDQALRLAKAFWPGPLTLVLPAKQSLPEKVLGPGNTLAVRVPGFTWLTQLLEQISSPLLAPSANFKGNKAPANSSEIDKELAKLVDYVVEIEPSGKQPSTIISFDEGRIKVLREGSILEKDLELSLQQGD